MKKNKVKALMYSVRLEIIEEIEEMERMEYNSAQYLIKDRSSFEYGYKRGLTEAAMIILDRIKDSFPKQSDD